MKPYRSLFALFGLSVLPISAFAQNAADLKGLTPEFAVQSALKLDEDAVAPWRRFGFTAQLVTLDGGYFSGTIAFVNLSGAVPREAPLRTPVMLHAKFGRVVGSDYPTALMGVLAHESLAK